jgi:hypothetical protein
MGQRNGRGELESAPHADAFAPRGNCIRKMFVLKWLPGRLSVLALFTAPMRSAPEPGTTSRAITTLFVKLSFPPAV